MFIPESKNETTKKAFKGWEKTRCGGYTETNDNSTRQRRNCFARLHGKVLKVLCWQSVCLSKSDTEALSLQTKMDWDET